MAVVARNFVLPWLNRLLAIALLTVAVAAGATGVQVREQLQPAAAPAKPAERGWTWLALENADTFDELPAGWRLLVDQVRFEEVGVVVVRRDGRTTEIFRTADQLQHNW